MSLNKIQVFYRIITSYLCRTTTVCCNALAGSYRSILHGALGSHMIWGLRSVGIYCWISVIYIYISVISGWVVWLRDFLLISSYFPFSGWALYRTEIWGCGPFPNAFRASPSRTVASLLALAVVALRSVLPGGNPITGGWQQKKIHNFKWNLWISRWISRQSTDSDCCDLYMNWIPSCRSTIYSNSQQAIYDKNDQLKLAGRFFHDVLMINTLCTKNLFFLLQRMEKPNCQASELRTPYVAIPVQVSGPGQYFFW